MDISPLSHLPSLALQFSQTSLKERNMLIQKISETLECHRDEILVQNQKDLLRMSITDAIYDRVILSEKRIKSMQESCYELMEITDPLDTQYEQQFETQDGISLKSVPVPLGVVACIYEARPNVTLDLAILCIKSGNVCVLKGGSQATHTNAYLRKLIREVLEKSGYSPDIVFGFSEKREDLVVLLEAVGVVDVIIPRGGKGLIEYVRKNALVPIIETGAGVVHIYVDEYILPENFTHARDVILNAKISRPSVCNALDTIIFHKNTPPELVKLVIDSLLAHEVQLGVLSLERDFFGLENSNAQIIGEADYSLEHLSLKCFLKQVSNMDEALIHIAKYSSHHSECILTDDVGQATLFQKSVDSAVVYHNTSTRFSDGGCFGFGAEVGISTQKIHARGPMGCRALTTYKYLVDSPYLIRK